MQVAKLITNQPFISFKEYLKKILLKALDNDIVFISYTILSIMIHPSRELIQKIPGTQHYPPNINLLKSHIFF